MDQIEQCLVKAEIKLRLAMIIIEKLIESNMIEAEKKYKLIYGDECIHLYKHQTNGIPAERLYRDHLFALEKEYQSS